MTTTAAQTTSVTGANTRYLALYGDGYAALADINGDGFLDWYGLDDVSNEFATLFNNGDGTFSPPVTTSGFTDIVDGGAGGLYSWHLTDIKRNTDGDTLANHLDLDSDGDGIPDNVEAQANGTYIAPNNDAGPGNNGLDSAYGTGLVPIDTDGDIATVGADFTDTDTDNDTISDETEHALALSGTVGLNGLDDVLETAGTDQAYTDVNGLFTDEATFNGTSLPLFASTSIPTWRARAIPGGVDTNLTLWLKGDNNILSGDASSVPQWTDSSAGMNDVDQITATAQPTYYSSTVTELLNFNPSVSFDGGDDLENGTAFGDDRFFNATEPFSVFIVAQDERTNLGQLRAPLGLGDNGNDPAYDLQTDGVSPNGLNPFMDSSNPAELSGSALSLYNGNSGGNNIQPQIFGLSTPNTAGSGTSSDNITYFVDGLAEASTMDAYQQTTIGQNIWIGSSNDAQWLGNIAEVIVYTQDISTTDRNRIESYLALKYGITLDQSTPQNYIAGDGTTILWDATTNAGYDNDIAGIGRDDVQALNQKQSKSVNENSTVTIYNGDQSVGLPTTNTANTSTYAADTSVLIWGNNGLVEDYATVYVPNSFTPTAGYYIMSAIWKVQETGTVGTVTVNSSAGADHLIVHNSADFTSGTPTEIALTDDGSGNLVATVDFTDGQFFTFGKNIFSPGGVVTGLDVWYKGNQDLTVSSWTDANLGLVASQSTAANQPSIGLMNFNDAAVFDGSNDSFVINPFDGLLNGTIAGPQSYFSVVQPTVNLTASNFNDMRLFYISAPNNTNDFFIGGAGSHAYDESPSGQAVVGGANLTAGSVRQNFFSYSGNGSGNSWNSQFDGGTPSTGTLSGNVVTGGINSVTLGRTILGTFRGSVGEFIIYEQELTNPIEIRQVDSYLAIKYGTTLDNDNDGDATPLENIAGSINEGDYIASDGTTVTWDATANSTYHNDIAGIGRDDATALTQKQSKS